MRLVTSWDDGHPLDERLAGLLERFALKGTFFVPGRNREGRPVLAARALRGIDRQFEIGSHTLDHAPLTGLPREECRRQVVLGKDALEQMLGHQVPGFCYPGGRFDAVVRQSVMDAGCSYARSTENLRCDLGVDPFAIPTSLQFYPHRRPIFLRNYLRHGRYSSRFPLLLRALAGKDLPSLVTGLLDGVVAEGAVLHVWGHSWEIEELGLWGDLEAFCAAAARLRLETCTISEILNGRNP